MALTLGFMSVKTQFDNLGDALINKELAELVAARVPLTMDLTRSPKSFHATMAVEQIPNTTLISTGRGKMLVQMVRQAIAGNRCYFFLNPGGLGGGVGNSTKAFATSLIYNCILFALRLTGVRVCLVGVSFEHMTWRERLVTRFRRKICHSFAVRDEVSAEYLGHIGMPADEVVPDLSFNLYQKPHSYDAPRSIVSAFSFRTDHGLLVDLLANYAEKIIAASPADSQHAVLSQVGRDSRGMRALHAHLCRRFGERRIHYVEVESSLDTACQWYSKIEKIHSNRLHALLLAASCGTLPVAVLPSRKHVKVRALFDDLGLSSNVVDLEGDSSSAPRELSWTMGNLEYQRLESYFDRLLLDDHASASASNTPARQV